VACERVKPTYITRQPIFVMF